MKRVFVSYSRKNEAIVVQLVANLRAVGINTWYDQSLTGGQKWWDKILAGIRDCDVFVFALSPESLESEACRKELRYVGQLGKIVLPVLVSDVNLNLLPSPLNEIQVTDFRRSDQAAALALVKSILTSPESPVLPVPLPESPPVPISYVQTLAEKIASQETLSFEAQQFLLIEIEEEFEKGTSQTEIRDLLMRFKKRDDLLAKIDEKIDKLCENLQTPGRSDVPAVRPEPTPPPDPRLCPQCRREIKTESPFCANCGNRVQAQPAGMTSQMEGARVQQYRCVASKVPDMLTNIKGWLESQGFKAQTMNADSQSQLIQIKKKGSEWRIWLGMDTTLNILFRHSSDVLTVEIGAGKWIDKVAAGTLGAMLTGGILFVTAGIGAWEQAKIPDKIFEYIGTRLDYQ